MTTTRYLDRAVAATADIARLTGSDRLALDALCAPERLERLYRLEHLDIALRARSSIGLAYKRIYARTRSSEICEAVRTIQSQLDLHIGTLCRVQIERERN